MPIQKMSDRWLAGIQPGEKQVEYFDAMPSQTGLSLIVGKLRKTWFLNYTRNGARRRVKIGPYPQIGLSKARETANVFRLQIANGGDPAEERKAAKIEEKHGDTVADLYRAFLSSPAFRRNGARHQEEMSRVFERDIIPAIGSATIRDLTRRDLLKPCDLKASAGKHRAASLIFAYQRKALNWCVETGRLDASPMPQKYGDEIASGARERVLTDDELSAFGEWTKTLTGEMRAVFILLAMLGQRVTETAGMQRAEIDLSAGTWIIPPARTKNGREHAVFLPPAAAKLIGERMKAVRGQYLFPQRHGDKRPHLWRDTINAAARDGQGEKADKWTPHDLRRTMATRMHEAGIDPHIVEACLNHVSSAASGRAGVAGVYNRAQYSEQKKAAWNLWAEALAAFVGGGE